jgi:peroxiredoxin-like protein
MENQYFYHAKAQWHMHERGSVEAEHAVPRSIHFSAPPEFGGEAGMWTPEHFLMAAIASCYVATFRAVANTSRLEYRGLEVAVDGLLEKQEGGFRFTKVILRPSVILNREEDRERAVRMVEKAERACLVSRSLSSTVVLEPKILVEATAAV